MCFDSMCLLTDKNAGFCIAKQSFVQQNVLRGAGVIYLKARFAPKPTIARNVNVQVLNKYNQMFHHTCVSAQYVPQTYALVLVT